MLQFLEEAPAWWFVCNIVWVWCRLSCAESVMSARPNVNGCLLYRWEERWKLSSWSALYLQQPLVDWLRNVDVDSIWRLWWNVVWFIFKLESNVWSGWHQVIEVWHFAKRTIRSRTSGVFILVYRPLRYLWSHVMIHILKLLSRDFKDDICRENYS